MLNGLKKQVPMEYRGIEFKLVRTIAPSGWRWSVARGDREAVGTSTHRDDAIRRAHKTIDELLRQQARAEKLRDELGSG